MNICHQGSFDNISYIYLMTLTLESCLSLSSNLFFLNANFLIFIQEYKSRRSYPCGKKINY